MVWDLDAYFNSSIKIITVGSNPSDLEFASEDKRKKDSNENVLPSTPSFKRFKGAENIFNKLNLSEEEVKKYSLILNNYFKNKNRYNWFSCFEPILNGFLASYNEKGVYNKNEEYRISKYGNIAVHTDIYSPLATSPTWSDLYNSDKSILSQGTDLWVSLLEVLKPNVILMGYKPSDFKKIVNRLGLKKFNDNKEFFREYTKCKNGSPKKNTYCSLYVYDKNYVKSVVVYGTKANRPFDKITKEDRYILGRDVKNMLSIGGEVV
ncbi:hypothetical protein [Clostridium ljungdahlii]|uniref:hypothetical protein n=1 Tax=Clostridium ljungdahlii TaxID=1538 RepID=UPI003863173E